MNPKDLPNLSDFQLIDVRLSDDFAEAHVEGATNNCVYEVAFADRLPDTAPEPGKTTIVYGADGESCEADTALGKLNRLGYTDVHILEGGIEAALEAGLPIAKGTSLPAPPEVPEGTLDIDLEESRVEWLGRNLLNKHWGTAPIDSGHLVFENGKLTGGEIVIDLIGLKSDDLAGNDLHDVLIHHLHSDDFFDVENHPKATVRITGSEPTETGSPGAPNLAIHADLNLRGQTHPILFDASTGLTPEGKPAAQAAFSIDRTRWDVIYGSGKFFHRLAGHLVNDQIEFQIKIITQ